jgi:CBS domain-containing protein
VIEDGVDDADAATDEVVYASRVLRLPLLDVDGAAVGPVTDVVIGPVLEADDGPSVRGFLAAVQRRTIFVAASRIGWLDARGLQLSTGAVDLRPFRPRLDEHRVRELLGLHCGDEALRDIGLAPSHHLARSWVVATVALRHRTVIGMRGVTRVAPWREAAALFQDVDEPEIVKHVRGLHPSDAARDLLALDPDQRFEVVDGLTDEFLADVLEELPEVEQAEVLGHLAVARAADVVEEMQPDDATDLLGELADDRRQALLAEIEPARGARLRRLLSHDADSAGGLMTSDPIIVGPETRVAEALARIRQPEVNMALAAQVFVAEPPLQTPTGRYLGCVLFQRLLREPPGNTMADCLDTKLAEPISPDLPEVAVAQTLAAYNLVALAVCDPAGRLLGAVTVDDVLDRSLPADWRRQ